MVLGCFSDSKLPEGKLTGIDQTLDGAVSLLISQGEIRGKLGEVTVIHTLGKITPDRIVIAGLGKASEVTPEKVRGAIGEAGRKLRQQWVNNMASVALGAGLNSISLETAAQAVTEGALLGTYSFRRHMTGEAEYSEIKELALLSADDSEIPALTSGCRRGEILASAVNTARDMVNEPSNHMTPENMVEKAAELARSYGLKLTVLERDDMQKLGMGSLLGVARGSQEPPKLIVLEYQGDDTGKIRLALVGKGVTFDSGGISIKPSEKMGEMKGDMAGGAAVIAAISAIARLGSKINVVAIVPATENLPSSSALKPGDILSAMNGKTIEIISTDAEGRLILADALCYANKLGAESIVDVATLTGACVVALGKVTTGAFGNNQNLVDKVVTAGKDAGEPIWPMPMFEEYRELIKSEVADIKNVGGRPAGAITAAQFLAEFAGDTPWVHLDIAGTSMTEKEHRYHVKGATGVPVRTLVNLTLKLIKQRTT